MYFAELEQFRHEFQKNMVLAGIEFVKNTIQSVQTLKNPIDNANKLLHLVKSWSVQTKLVQLQKTKSLQTVVLLDKKYDATYSLNFQQSFDFFPDGTEIEIPILSEFFWMFLTQLDTNTNKEHVAKILKKTFMDSFILYSLKNVKLPNTNHTNLPSDKNPPENEDDLKISVKRAN